MNEVVANDKQATAANIVKTCCDKLKLPVEQEGEAVRAVLRIFQLNKNAGLSNARYQNNMDGMIKFVATCYQLKNRYPEINLVPDDVFSGTCDVKNNLMVYGKLAYKIGMMHNKFSRVETKQHNIYNAQNAIVATEYDLTIYGFKDDKSEYVAFSGNIRSTGADRATREADFSKFMRASLVKAFPWRYAYGYCEPEDAKKINAQYQKQAQHVQQDVKVATKETKPAEDLNIAEQIKQDGRQEVVNMYTEKQAETTTEGAEQISFATRFQTLEIDIKKAKTKQERAKCIKQANEMQPLMTEAQQKRISELLAECFNN